LSDPADGGAIRHRKGRLKPMVPTELFALIEPWEERGTYKLKLQRADIALIELAHGEFLWQARIACVARVPLDSLRRFCKRRVARVTRAISERLGPFRWRQKHRTRDARLRSATSGAFKTSLT
jgi:hypothetical protein